jgi:hypothetical protein
MKIYSLSDKINVAIKRFYWIISAGRAERAERQGRD